MTKHCSVLGLPIQAGAGRGGCLMGPDALRTAGLIDQIRELGYAIDDLGNMPAPVRATELDDQDHLVNLSEIIAWTSAIQQAVYSLGIRDTLPIFLGGDHSMAAGTLTGLAKAAAEREQPQFVLWLDAHPDMNTLQSTRSGHLHGVPMAYALGLEGFADTFPAVLHTLDPKNICMLGLRSVDPPEHALIHSLGMDVWDMRRIDEEGVRKPVLGFLEKVRKANGRLHVSFDVDFLDPEIAPAVGTTVPGGATFREAHLIMELLADSALVTSFELAELNPFLDYRGKTARLMCDVAASILGKRILDRPTERY